MRAWGLIAALLWFVTGSALAGIMPQSGGPTMTPPANDLANAVVTGSFSGTGQSARFTAWGKFNVAFGGASGPNGSWNATIRIERSFDGGTVWLLAGIGGGGQQAIYSTPNQDVSVTVTEPERGVLYRLNCSAYTSGTISYRLSTTGGAAATWSP